MKLVLYFVILSCSLYSCAADPGKSPFSRYCSTLKVINTPYQMNCGLWERDYVGSNQDTSLQRQLQMRGQVVGRIFDAESVVVILTGIPGDDIYPELLTFSSAGIRIDSLYLGGSCQGDSGYHASSTVTLNSDRSILQIDSAWTYAGDTFAKRIPHSGSTAVEVKKFTLDAAGRFHSVSWNADSKINQ